MVNAMQLDTLVRAVFFNTTGFHFRDFMVATKEEIDALLAALRARKGALGDASDRRDSNGCIEHRFNFKMCELFENTPYILCHLWGILPTLSFAKLSLGPSHSLRFDNSQLVSV